MGVHRLLPNQFPELIFPKTQPRENSNPKGKAIFQAPLHFKVSRKKEYSEFLALKEQDKDSTFRKSKDKGCTTSLNSRE